jgi:outer membrane protein, heavy metal efflux system
MINIRKFTISLMLILYSVLLTACNVLIPSPQTTSHLRALEDYREKHWSSREEQLHIQNSTKAANEEITSLDELLDYALSYNPAVSAARLRWEGERESVVQAGTLPDPEFSYRYMAMDTSGDLSSHTLTLSQMFPWFGTLSLSREIASARARSAYEEFVGVRLSTISSIKSTWAEYVYLHEASEIINERIDILTQANDVIEALYQTNKASQADLLRNENEVERLKKQREDIIQLIKPISEKLNAKIGRNTDAPLPPPNKLPEASIEINKVEFREKLLAHNPTLISLKHAISASDAEVNLAKKKYYPQLMLGAEYGLGTNRRMARMDGGDRDSLGAMVGIKVPIWFESYSAGVREKRAKREATELELNNEKNLLESELAFLLFQLDEAGRRVSLFGDRLIPSANQVLDTTNASYAANEASFTDLLAAERELLEFKLAYRRAIADRYQRLAAIEQMLGAAFSKSISDK